MSIKTESRKNEILPAFPFWRLWQAGNKKGGLVGVPVLPEVLAFFVRAFRLLSPV
jgi:hypothetical protein